MCHLEEVCDGIRQRMTAGGRNEWESWEDGAGS
jgi:hypothetical protein